MSPSLKPMPCVALETAEHDVRDERAHTERLAGKADAERVAHEAAAAAAPSAASGILHVADRAGRDYTTVSR
jgi:hypothetical protein